jgi:Mannosyltransferase putative
MAKCSRFFPQINFKMFSRSKWYLLLIILFSIVYFLFKGEKPASFHHTKAIYKPKESVLEEYDRIFASSLDKFDHFYKLDFTAQRLRLLPKLTGAVFEEASAKLFPWYAKGKSKLHKAASRFTGAGVVMIVNNLNVKKVLTTLKNLDKSIAVELFYMGFMDLSLQNIQLLKTRLVTPVDLYTRLKNIDGLHQKDIIPFVILASSFEHVIYLEVGSFLFTTPELLSLQPGYQRYGALFFKDGVTEFTQDDSYYHLAMAHMDALFMPDTIPMNPFIAGESSTYQNPSLLMIDKVRAFSGLTAVCTLMMASAGQSRFLLSEVFWVVFDTVGAEYSFYPHRPQALIDSSKDKHSVFDKVYLDDDGKILWMSGEMIDKNIFTKGNSTVIPSSMKLAEIKSLARGYNGMKTVLPNNIYPLTSSQSNRILLTAETAIQARKTYDRSRKQPKQISPWSYKSVACKSSTSKAAFNEWVAERKGFWDSLDDYFLMEKQKELHRFMEKLNSTEITVKPESYSGEGIIYSCHPGIIKTTVISINIVRKYGCNLPIELWYFKSYLGISTS